MRAWRRVLEDKAMTYDQAVEIVLDYECGVCQVERSRLLLAMEMVKNIDLFSAISAGIDDDGELGGEG